MRNANIDSVRKKLQYIWDYEKLPIFLTVLSIYIFCSVFIHFAISAKPVCYAGFVNVAISNETEQHLVKNFIRYLNSDSRKNKVETYQNLYLTENTDDPEYGYAYASKIKLMAAIDAENLDFVIMNKEALNTLSKSGYLQDMDSFLKTYTPDLSEDLSAYIVDSAGLDLSFSSLITDAGFPEAVYFGVVANSPRNEVVGTYLDYLVKSLQD